MMKEKNDQNPQKENTALTFLIGIVMLAAGLFWLTQIVHVSSDWWGGWQLGGVSVSGGMTLVPLIAGIVWLFFNPKSVGAKILSLLGGVFLVAAILMSVRFYVRGTSLFVFLLIFIFIAGGSGLVLRSLLKKR